jgi:hypothetical protein
MLLKLVGGNLDISERMGGKLDICRTNIYMHVASSRKDLLLDIQEIKAWDCTSLRILVTSRPEFDIDIGIRPLCTRQLCL